MRYVLGAQKDGSRYGWQAVLALIFLLLCNTMPDCLRTSSPLVPKLDFQPGPPEEGGLPRLGTLYDTSGAHSQRCRGGVWGQRQLSLVWAVIQANELVL